MHMADTSGVAEWTGGDRPSPFSRQSLATLNREFAFAAVLRHGEFPSAD